ncbi:MAG: 4Fe-4S dicluster domain-containing protein [Desulfobacterales bacterium]|nr:4Fe-4S dicluster domain-containing protein [Desulfobacterales bacterium]
MKRENAKRYGMVIDLDKCTGCGACMVACMSENNVPFKADETDKLKSITWMKIYKLDNGKSFPDQEVCYLPRPCMHCEGSHGHSPCVSVCPATATDYSLETGIVSQIYTRCFGCRYCMGACPYHARFFNWWDPVWPDGMEKYLSPNVSPRMRGVVEKCSFCFHRYQLAMEKAYMEDRRELEEEEYQTSCTQACPSGAITFGDLNNPDHAVHQLTEPDLKHGGRPHAKNVFRILERLGTNPKVYYHSSKEWVRRQGDNYRLEEVTGEPKKMGHH